MGVMVHIALHPCACNSSDVWTAAANISVDHLPRRSSSSYIPSTRVAASNFLSKGFGTFRNGSCLTMQCGNVAYSLMFDANPPHDPKSVFSHEAAVITAEAIAQARLAKRTAVAPVPSSVDEVASAVTWARATVHFANNLTMFTHANFWHGSLPLETYVLRLERAGLRGMEQHKFLDVLEERMIIDNEWQGMRDKASVLSLDGAQVRQGSRFYEDVVPLTTPSAGTIPIAAKSLRHDERVAKRMRASAKAKNRVAIADTAASAATAPPPVWGKFVKTSEYVKACIATNSRTGHKLLTRAEEVQLSRKVQDLLRLEAIRNSLRDQLGKEPTLTEWARAVNMTVGSLSARLHDGRLSKDRMIQGNLRLVVSLAKEYEGRGLSLEDLVQAGNIGLMRGCKKFDPEKGFKFSTYAYYWIRQGIMRKIFEQAHTIRIPEHVSTTTACIRNAKEKLCHEYQNLPCEEDVAKTSGITMVRLQKISRSFRTCRSLDKRVGKENNMKLWDLIADQSLEHPESIIDRHFFKQDLNNLLETLSEREMAVVKQHFGLEGGKPTTARALGIKYNLTAQTIGDIKKRALQKLQRSRVLKEYIYDNG